MESSARPQRLARATLIVATLFVCSRLLGLARDILIAARFGTSPEYAAYVAAFRIPDLLFLVVMSGAFGSAFIPVYGEFLVRGSRPTAYRLANTLLTVTIALFLLFGALVLIFADRLMATIVAPGLPPKTAELAARLTRLLVLSPLCLGIGAAAKAMLEAESRFTVPAVAPLLYNLGIIAGTLFLAPFWGVFGLATGVVVGAVLYALVQVSALVRSGWFFVPSVAIDVPGLREVLALLGPRLIGQAAMQVNLLITTNLASRISDQSIAALQYAYQLFLLPHGIFALSAATVLFPTLTRQRAEGAVLELQRTIAAALRLLTLVSLLGTIVFLGFARSLVQTLFQFGAFTATSTTLVSEALQWFAPGLVAYSVVELLTRLSYAYKDSRAPVVAAVIAVLVNFIAGLILMRPFGHRGLALSLALATTVEMVVLARSVGIRARFSYRPVVAGLWRAIPAIVAAAVATAWFAAPVSRLTDPTRGRSFLDLLAVLYVLGTIAVTFLLIGVLCRQQDLVRVTATARRVLAKPARSIRTAILGR